MDIYKIKLNRRITLDFVLERIYVCTKTLANQIVNISFLQSNSAKDPIFFRKIIISELIL